MEFKKWAVQPTSEPGSARSNLNSSRSRVVSRLMTTRDQEMSGSKVYFVIIIYNIKITTSVN